MHCCACSQRVALFEGALTVEFSPGARKLALELVDGSANAKRRMEVAWKNVTGLRALTPVGAHALTAWMVLAVCSAAPRLVDLQLSWSADFAPLFNWLGSRAPTGSVECWRWTWRSRPPSPSRSRGPSGSPPGRPAQTSLTAKPLQPSAPYVPCALLAWVAPTWFLACLRGGPCCESACANAQRPGSQQGPISRLPCLWARRTRATRQ